MRNRNIVGIATVALAAAFASGPVSGAAASPESHGASDTPAARPAKASLAEAIAAAEKKTGGRAVKAEMERHRRNHGYEVTVLSQDKTIEVRVDPASGQVTDTEIQGLWERLFDWGEETEFRKIAVSPVTLAAATATAEKKVGGKAVEASIEDGDDDGKMLFEIRVAKDQALRTVKIDSASGKVVKVTASGEGKDEEG